MSTVVSNTESAIQVKPSELETLLTFAIQAREPVLISGAPGLGKSQISRRAIKKANARMILSHPAVSDPTKVEGLPFLVNNQATFLPFGDLREALTATSLTAWVLEDLGQATAAVQASYMQLLLDRRVNDHMLPDWVTFIACTNRRVDRAGVTGILEPVKSRFATIVELVVDVDEWCMWALTDGNMPAELVAFIRFRRELLSAHKPTADIVNSPMPRTWEAAGRWMQRGMPDVILRKAIAGSVGVAAATELTGFLALYKQIPSIDGILIDPDTARIATEPHTLYAVVTGVGARVTVQNFGRIVRYAQRLADAGHGEFATLLVMDCVRKEPAVKETVDFTKLMTSDLGQLIAGTRRAA